MGKLILVAIMVAAVTVSCTSDVKTSSEVSYEMGETKEEAVRERGEKRREAIEEDGDAAEHAEWREWDNRWIELYQDKFGNASAADIKPLDLDLPTQQRE